MLMLGIGIDEKSKKDGRSGGGISSVCVDEEAVRGSIRLGVGGDSWYGDVGVLGGLRGSSAVWDEPLTIKLLTTGGLIVNGWAM